MNLSDNLRIETPEQIDLNLELAGLGTRFLGQLLDWVIKIVVTLLLMIIAGLTIGLVGHTIKDLEAQWAVFGALGILLAFAIWFGYDVLFEVRWNGQTPGKHAVGARVIMDGGAPLDFSAACIRNFVGMADFLPFFYLFGSLMILLTEKKQRLGDLAAGTIVVRDRSDSIPAESATVAEDFALADLAFSAGQLGKCTPEDLTVLRSFFQRLPEMDSHARHRLAFRLSTTFTSRWPETPRSDHISPTNYLATLMRDLQRHLRHG